MSQADEDRDNSPHRSQGRAGGRHRSRRRSNGRDQTSSEDKASPGSWNIDRGRSRTRRPSNPVSENNLRRRGYHTLYSSFGKVFHVERRWKMIRDMGSGAYGVVISAADEISGETVAIKLVTRVFDKVSLAKRALREITLLRHFSNHENITGLIDVDAISKDFNEVYLFMEPMEADLHQIIKSGQTLTNEHVQYFVYQILRGMKYIHSAAVVHRDLKPGNLLVNADCELKICDFGLSRGFDAKPDETATHMTEYVATRWYRAPEIMLAFPRYGTAIDVWSIGCILAELILGRPLFKGKDYVDQLNKILDVLGTPNEAVIQRIGSERAQAYVRSLPLRKSVPLRKILPSADEQAIDLLTKMLAFDPSQRITVPEALEHPWLASYHDINDEPDCPTLFDKWRDIEKLETIDEYREALWNEIEDFRREARSINYEFSQPLGIGIGTSPGPRFSKSASPETTRKDKDDTRRESVDALPPDAHVGESIVNGAESTTAVEDASFPQVGGKSKGPATPSAIPATATNSGTGAATVVPASTPVATSAGGLRPIIDRRDSLSPTADYCDPVVSYARRSSILQAHQAAASATASAAASVSPTGPRAISGLPTYAEDEDPIAYAPKSSAASGAPPLSRTASTSMDVNAGTGTIPFPSSGPSYIVPARSRTASIPGDHYNGTGASNSAISGPSLTTGPRKLLRTLSTVSIHETVDGINGLVAMGPIGQAIIERQETAADAPASEMPRDFETLNEEDELRFTPCKRSGSGSGGRKCNPEEKPNNRQEQRNEETPSSTSSDDHNKDKHEHSGNGVKARENINPGESSVTNTPGNSSPASQQKKKEKRFILF